MVTDGEFRRGSYWGRFVERTDGFEVRKAIFTFRDDHGHEAEFTAPYAAGKIARARPLALDEFEFLRDATRVTPKITLPSPSTMHFYRCTDFADRAVYPDVERFFADLATIFRQEIAGLVAAGCRYVQIDEVAIALLCDPAIRERVTAVGADPDRLVDLYVDAINQAVADCPADVVVGVHMCRGNFKGPLPRRRAATSRWRSGSSPAPTPTISCSSTTRRGPATSSRCASCRRARASCSGWSARRRRCWKAWTTLRRRAEEAARYIDLDRLAIGPQCGFASSAAGNPLTEADERAKLRLVVEAARAIWG